MGHEIRLNILTHAITNRYTFCAVDLFLNSFSGVMCEYDALPGIGHACGHNLIAILGLAVACGIKDALDSGDVKGKVS